MKKMIWVITLIFTGIFQAPAYAEEPFEISIRFFSESGYFENIYYEPRNKIVKVRQTHGVKPVKVVVKNISSKTQRLVIDQTSKGLDLITFEITDERGRNNVVSKKVDAYASRSEGYNYLGPGETKEFEIVLNESEWNNALKLLKEGATKVKARATYKNGSEVIYSDYYTLVLEE